MNNYTAVTIINVSLIIACVIICFITQSLWGMIVLLGMMGIKKTKKEDYDNDNE